MDAQFADPLSSRLDIPRMTKGEAVQAGSDQGTADYP